MYGAMTMHATSRRWRDGTTIIVTGRTPYIHWFWDRGPLGEHFRWMLRQDRMRKSLLGEDVLVRGPWPFGMRFPAMLGVHFVRVGPLTELAGWALTVWIITRTLKRR